MNHAGGPDQADKRTAGVLIGGVVGFLLLTGLLNSMGGLDAVLGDAPPGNGPVRVPAQPPTVSREDLAAGNDSLATQVYESGIALSLSQQRLVAAVTRAYPRFAGHAGRVLSLGDSVCRRLDRGYRPPLVAATLVRDGIPVGAAAYIVQQSIQQRCPEQQNVPPISRSAGSRWWD